MDMFQYLLTGFGNMLSPNSLFACFSGVFVGTLIGVLPGIGPVATMAILLPVTYVMTPFTAIIMLCGIYYGAQYGGSTTSILVNIPGEVGSIVTCLDGYQMARKGRAGVALGISAIGSFVGGMLGVFGLMLLVPSLSKVALGFGPPELFALVVFGLMMVASLGTGSTVKSLIMAVFGLFVSLIGQESFTGYSRFTLGSMTLSDGVGLVPVAMGMYGLGEILINMEQGGGQREVFKAKLHGLLPNRKDLSTARWPIFRGTLIGFFLGILPGAGVVLTTFFAYWLEKRVSKSPERFGTGMIEGVAAPETANNAATAGAMVPLIALGVPATPTMAMLLAAFIVQGIQPGPFFIGQYPDLFWGIIVSMFVGNVMLLVLNLPLIGIWVKLLKVPYTYLFPQIILFCMIGAYSIDNNVYEVLIMVLFGIIGYFLRKLQYPLAPFLLAMVLGPMLETSFRQSMAIGHGSPIIFLQRSFCAVLLFMTLVIIIVSAFSLAVKKKIQETDG
jgi:putative tricarboxylic transport membrane protein